MRVWGESSSTLLRDKGGGSLQRAQEGQGRTGAHPDELHVQLGVFLYVLQQVFVERLSLDVTEKLLQTAPSNWCYWALLTGGGWEDPKRES